ncbi:MAG: hypothetical protein DMG65_05730 [Candidatus Angelobacter sp. Gp1-AA117]|nr:MAG: hypothetical protein DMG65_05730 [Candidatus Angelobacter sp. Gp1-AA117]
MNIKLRDIMALVAVTLALVWCIPSVGQVIKGSISGTVTDPQGAVVANAQVKAKNVDTGQVSTTTSDNSGNFRLNLLSVGTYTVEITAQGFKTATHSNVPVAAGADYGIGSIKMSVGETTTTVEVSADAPLIETTQAQVTNTFTSTTLKTFAGIEENEGLDRLALFVPGVASSRSNNFSNTNGASISSNGNRGRNNDQEIDGQNNNDNSVGGPGLFVSNTEFVQQYVIVTNQFGPEYGRNAGSVVNVITKSGTNSWHGSLFGTNNNSFTSALSNTQHNTPKPGTTTSTNPQGTPFTGPPRSNEEFTGGTMGGPLLKNKLFIFGGFDNDLFSGTSVFTTTSRTPTPNGLSKLAGCGVNTTALSIMQSFGPYAFSFGNPTPRSPQLANIGTCTGANGVEIGGVTRVVTTPFHGFDWVLRTDLQLGGDTITSRYIFNRGSNFNISDNGAGGWVRNTPALSQAVLESWTHNFSSRMVNEARIGFNRLNVEFGGGLNPFEPDAGHLLNAFTNIAITGFLGLGPATNLPQSRLVNDWQAQDNWNYVLGKHNFKSGVNWTYQRSPNIFLPIVNGAYRFSSLNTFLTTNTPNRVQIANGNPNLDFREYDTFLYFGDDWKIKQNLTINAGLTWTYYGQPANLFNQLTTQVESNPSTALWLQSLPLAQRTNPQIPAVKNSFGPSIGFAYSPQWGGFLTGHGKTVFRGGYRMLYDPPFYNIFVNISSSAPMTFLQTVTTGLNSTMLPATPTGPNVRAQLSPLIQKNTFDPRTQNETNVSPNFGPDKVHSWSAGFEREITKNAAFEARYSGTHGFDLFQTVDSNPFLGTTARPGLLQNFPQFLPPGTPTTACQTTQQVGPGAGTDVGRVNCGVGVSRTRNNGGFNDYNAMQLEFRANDLFKQLTMRTGYTWSKNLDNVSEIFATGTAGNTLFASQNPFQTGGAERSTSGLDYTHIWTILFTEQIPFFKEQHGVVGHLLGGWTLSANYILGSGQPYTPQQNGEAFQTATGNYYDSAFVGAFVGVDSARPFFGNKNAPANAVGIYAGDACTGFAAVFGVGGVACALPANTLISMNALNGNKALLSTTTNLVTVTPDQVRFIINGRVAQSVFGTPFGNVPRNPQRDAISNIANASVFKNFKLGERVNFEMHMTALNALNHYNFASIDANLENAGVGVFGSDFANPSVTAAGGRTVIIGGKVTF